MDETCAAWRLTLRSIDACRDCRAGRCRRAAAPCSARRRTSPSGRRSRPSRPTGGPPIKHRKRYVPGRGYYVEGISGFFDESGRKIHRRLDTRACRRRRRTRAGFSSKMAPKKAGRRLQEAGRQGPNETIARKCSTEGDALVPAEEVRRGSREVSRGLRALARLAAGRRGHVQSGRERVLRRSLLQGRRRLRHADQEVSLDAVPQPGGHPGASPSAVIGSSTTRPIRIGR